MLTEQEFEEYLTIAKEKGATETDAVYCMASFEPPQAAHGTSIPQTAFHLGTLGELPLMLYACWMKKSRSFMQESAVRT